MHRLQPILEQTLGKKMVLPECKLGSIEAFLERYSPETGDSAEHPNLDGDYWQARAGSPDGNSD